MKIQILILTLLTIQVYGQSWVLVWSDDFNGNSLDGSKWNLEQGNNNGWGNNELQYYTSNNHQVSNGELIITAKKENYGGFQYTSTRMTTQNKFSITYGKFEMRAKLPYGQGIWPAFWLLGSNISQKGWPACGEIDIMEFIGKNPNNVYGSVHGTGFDDTKTYTNIYGFSQSYHTYAVDWQPNSISYYVDGNLFGQSNGHTLFNNNPMFILVNLAIGGNWPGNPDSKTVFPQYYTIDYIRVYEKVFQPDDQIENPYDIQE